MAKHKLFTPKPMLIKLHSLPIDDPIINRIVMPYLIEKQEFLKFSFHDPKLLILAPARGNVSNQLFKLR